MNSIKLAQNAINELLIRGGTNVDAHTNVLLFKESDNLDEDEIIKARQLNMFAVKGFLDCASEGYIFAPISEIKEQFGFTIEENYPDAGDSFIRFAKTFWTLNIVQEKLRKEDKDNIILFSILDTIHRSISMVAIPFPGDEISNKEMIVGITNLINTTGANINTQQFIKDNPFIKSRGGGCLTLLAISSIIIFIGILVIIVFI